jgi:hypothetical protein
MQVKVIFPKLNEEWKMNASGDHVREFIWTAPGETDKEALEQTFREFNVVLEDDSHIARECRSMSVGDIAICIDSLGERIYICDNCGWKLVDGDVAKDLWMKLPFSKRMKGFGAAI